MKRYDMIVANWRAKAVETEDGGWVQYEDVAQAIKAAILAERAACAELVERYGVSDFNDNGQIAQDIRSRPAP